MALGIFAAFAGLPTDCSVRTKKEMPVASKPPTDALRPHEVLLSPTVQSAVNIHGWSKFAGEPDLAELVGGLHQQIMEMQGGGTRPVEAILYGQAVALQTIFTNLSRRAANQEYLKQFQIYLTLAFKAQAQCRATLEALAEMKNPRSVAFVKQANVGHNVQVNNGAVPTGLRAGEFAGRSNELLEEKHGQGLDAGATGAAIGADTHLETVGALNRTDNDRR